MQGSNCLLDCAWLAFACSWFRSPSLPRKWSCARSLDLPTSTNLRQSPTGVPTPAPWRLSLTGTLFSRDPGLCEVDGLNCRSAQGSAQASIGGKKVTFTQAPLNVEIIRETRMVMTYVSFWSFCDHSKNYWGWMQDDKIIKAKKVVKKNKT